MENPGTKSVDDPVDVVRDAFAAKQRRNPHYSLRAFAAHLGLPPGRTSEILARKRALTPALATKLAERLALPPEQAKAFLQAARASKSAAHGPSRPDPEGDSNPPAYSRLSQDAFTAIAQWEHFALLSLLETDDARDDLAWIASRLGVPGSVARAALERLARLGLVERQGNTLRPTNANLSVGDADPCAALRASHRESLEQALEALESVPMEARDVSSVTMAIDVGKLPEARALIKDFRRRLAALLESGPRTEVYNLNIQLLPVTKRNEQ